MLFILLNTVKVSVSLCVARDELQRRELKQELKVRKGIFGKEEIMGYLSYFFRYLIICISIFFQFSNAHDVLKKIIQAVQTDTL